MSPSTGGHVGSSDSPNPGGAHVPPDFVDGFSSSMPARYRVLFDPRAVRPHAAVAYGRIGKLADVGVWRSLPDGTTALCIVADDRPGLLLRIAAVLASHRLSVVTALLYARTTSAGGREAVDLFWVQRAESPQPLPIDADEAAAMAHVLSALIAGAVSIDDVAPEPPLASIELAASSVVRFEEKDDAGSAVLTVESADAPALLLVIARTLFAHGAQIVRSLVRTVDGRVHNRFDLLEVDGRTISPPRRASIRAAVAGALAQRSVRVTRD